MISVIEKLEDLFIALGLAHGSAECFFGEIFEDRFHCLEVIFGLVCRSQEHHDGVDRELVARLEVDSGLAESDRSGEVGDLGVFDVGDRDAVSETGRGFAFSFEDFAQQFISDISGRRLGADQEINHLCDGGVSVI